MPPSESLLCGIKKNQKEAARVLESVGSVSEDEEEADFEGSGSATDRGFSRLRTSVKT